MGVTEGMTSTTAASTFVWRVDVEERLFEEIGHLAGPTDIRIVWVWGRVVANRDEFVTG